MRTDHVVSAPTSSPIMSTIPNFLSDFITIFHLSLQNLPYLAIFSIHSSHAFHSSPSRGLFQCKYRNINISKFMAGEFHWNGTGICRNDRNPAGISGASIRAPFHPCTKQRSYDRTETGKSCHCHCIALHSPFMQSLPL